MCGIAWLKENGCSEFLHVCFSEQHLDTHGSGGMGACMLRVSRRLVCPFTLIVSYLGVHIGHYKAQGGDERERGAQTRFHDWRLVLEKCLCAQGALVRLLLLPLRRRSMKMEHEEDGDGAGGEGGVSI